MIDWIMHCSCGYRRSWFNPLDELFMISHKIRGHKIIRSGKDIRNDIKKYKELQKEARE